LRKKEIKECRNLSKKLEMKEKISKNVGTCIRNLRWGGRHCKMDDMDIQKKELI
jgi:hypothetical protein